jgi:hypothetical protein
MMAVSLRMDIHYPRCDKKEERTAAAFDHSQRCPRCGGPYRHARHQIVLAALRSVAGEFGITVSDNFYTTMGVESTSKRPDAIIYRTGTDDRPLVIDVSVPHQSASLRYDASLKMHGAKRHKYAKWNDETVEFQPFIVSTIGSLSVETTFKV